MKERSFDRLMSGGLGLAMGLTIATIMVAMGCHNPVFEEEVCITEEHALRNEANGYDTLPVINMSTRFCKTSIPVWRNQ